MPCEVVKSMRIVHHYLKETLRITVTDQGPHYEQGACTGSEMSLWALTWSVTVIPVILFFHATWSVSLLLAERANGYGDSCWCWLVCPPSKWPFLQCKLRSKCCCATTQFIAASKGACQKGNTRTMPLLVFLSPVWGGGSGEDEGPWFIALTN